MTERGVPVVFRPENPRREAATRGSSLTVYVPGKSLFHDMRNRVGSGTDGLRGAVQQLRQHLPPTWSVAEAARVHEATIVIRAPDSRLVQLVVVSRRRIEPKDVAGILPTGRPQRSRATAVLVTAPFLSPRTRELFAAAGANYLDSTGNLMIALERPAVFLEAHGAQKDFAREPRPLVSLKGPVAGHVVRALCDFRPPCPRARQALCDRPGIRLARRRPTRAGRHRGPQGDRRSCGSRLAGPAPALDAGLPLRIVERHDDAPRATRLGRLGLLGSDAEGGRGGAACACSGRKPADLQSHLIRPFLRRSPLGLNRLPGDAPTPHGRLGPDSPGASGAGACPPACLTALDRRVRHQKGLQATGAGVSLTAPRRNATARV